MTEAGKLYCTARLPDYIPPYLQSLQFWVDFGDTVIPERCLMAEFLRRPVFYATGGMLPLTDHPFLVCDPRIYKANRRNVVAFQGGASSVWTQPCTGWTVSVFVRLERPARDCGRYPGVGPITMVYFPHLDIRVTVPEGGIVPPNTVRGVHAGWPWDAAFVNQWRHVVVRNDPSSGEQAIFVDGHPVTVGPATTQEIPFMSPVSLFPGPVVVTVAEVTAWHTAELQDVQIKALFRALQTKWKLHPPEPDTPDLETATLGQADPVLARCIALPRNIPRPFCWIDALSACQDDDGQRAAVGYQTVCRVDDRRGGGCPVFFPPGRAVLANGLFDQIDLNPVLRVSGSGAFRPSPLSGIPPNGSYTIVAAWRHVDGAHPFATQEWCTLGAREWTEGIGSVTPRHMPAPDITDGDVCVAMWQRNGSTGQLHWSLATSSALDGSRWIGVAEPDDGMGEATPRIGNADRGLHLGEILVWRLALRPPELSQLSHYLVSRWGVGLSHESIPKVLPAPDKPE